MLGTVTITSQAFRDTWGSPAGQWNHSLCIQHASAEICVCERTVTSCNSGCIMWHDILSLPSSVDVFKHVVAASNCVIWLPTAFQFNSEYNSSAVAFATESCLLMCLVFFPFWRPGLSEFRPGFPLHLWAEPQSTVSSEQLLRKTCHWPYYGCI